MAESSKKNLYQKLLAITEEIGMVAKTGKNTQQGYGFIEAAAISAEVRVQLAKHGVVIIPETVSRTIERYIKVKPGYKAGDPSTEQATFHANVVSRYTLVNADDPTDRQVCEWDGGEALDTSDKATNKAITASNKYFLMKLFNISDKDDPDAGSPEAPVNKPSQATQLPQDEPSRDINADLQKLEPKQVVALYGALKLKGVTGKEQAIEILNRESGLDDFTTMPERDYIAFYRKMRDADAGQLIIDNLKEPF